MGPLLNKKEPKLIGGTIVLFQNLLTELDRLDYKYTLIDTNKKNYSNIFFAYLSILCQLLIKQYRVNQISLHSSKDYKFFVPVLIIIGKIFNKKISLRKFGGEAWTHYSRSKGLKRYILRNIFQKVDYLFLELKFLVKNFQHLNTNTYWFPNVRAIPKLKVEEKYFSKKFVFISHVKQSKGIDEIVKATQLLDSSYTIDIYGLISDEKYSEEYFKSKKVSYKYGLALEELLTTLHTYDVLLLPTTGESEGYPGILIDSYSLGIPIIATNLQGISEIVDNYKSGILIEPNDVTSLKNAIEYFNEDNYQEMSNFAKAKFSLFNSTKHTKLFLEYIIK